MTLTKEWLQQTIAELEEERDAIPGAVNENAAMALEAMKLALAALTAEPVSEFYHEAHWGWYEISEGDSVPERARIPLYRVPPAPASVPDELLSAMEDVLRISDRDHDAWHKAKAGIVSCRAAMLQGAAGNSSAIPDDVRRMDWLVSKTVDVREPMVYGSHSLFWSQTITDEEDDYHATKLREQIDAAMAAENAAAPQ